MKYLGIDYGTRKTGLAVSDDSGSIAFARGVVATQDLFDELSAVIAHDEIGAVVVGKSDSGSATPNVVAAHIDTFVQEFSKKFTLPLYQENEYGTSAHARALNDFTENKPRNQARKTKQSREPVDAQAAALILQRYLDKQKG